MKPNWKYISLFIILAIGISAPVHLGYLDKLYKETIGIPLIEDMVYLLAGFGPLLAGLILLFLNKNVSNQITIFGKDRIKNILISILPVFTFPIFGLENSYGINIHLYALIYAFINVVYAFLEEFGWRRYLQNSLEGINKDWKYILIGTIWWIWHLRFETQFDLFIFPVICIGGGYLLGKLADTTKSVLPIVTIHTLIILLTNSGAITINKVIGVGLTIVVWVLIEQIWGKSKLPNRI